MIISAWKPLTESPALGGLMTLLEVSSAFCKFQAANVTGQLPMKTVAFLQSGQVQAKVAQALANAKTPKERLRIQRAYDKALERAKTGEINISDNVPKTEKARKSGTLRISPGGKASEPRPLPQGKNKGPRARARDTLSNRW